MCSAPSTGCRRRAESPPPRRCGTEPSPASLLHAAPQLRTAGRDEQTSCQSRRAAARPAARKQLLLPPRCRRASTSSNASARARPPGSSRAQTSRLACQPLLAARRGAFSNMKSFWRGRGIFKPCALFRYREKRAKQRTQRQSLFDTTCVRPPARLPLDAPARPVAVIKIKNVVSGV